MKSENKSFRIFLGNLFSLSVHLSSEWIHFRICPIPRCQPCVFRWPLNRIFLGGQFYPEFNLRSGLNIFPPRYILQLHHDDGGEQCGVDCGGAQLSPQDRRDPRHAYVGGWSSLLSLICDFVSLQRIWLKTGLEHMSHSWMKSWI